MKSTTTEMTSQPRTNSKFIAVLLLCFIIPPAGLFLAYLKRQSLKDGGIKQYTIKLGLIALATTLGVIMYVVAYSQIQDSRHPTRKFVKESQKLLNQPDGISYEDQKLIEYKVPGTQQKTKDGMSFKAPEIFTQAPGYEQQKTYNSAIHMSTITKGQVVSSISAASHTLNNSASGKSKEMSNSAISKSFEKKDAQYLVTNGQLRTYITNILLPKGYTAVLDEPEEFRADNVKKDAWVFDLSAINAKGQTVAIEGNAYVIYGNGTYYYFVIYTLPYNWIPNHAVWRDIENSIKIDQ